MKDSQNNIQVILASHVNDNDQGSDHLAVSTRNLFWKTNAKPKTNMEP